jgi:predicted nucleic acid-binding protein
MRIFLDANILFSAAKSDGAVRRLLGMLVDAGHTCCVDDYVVAEARRNLARKGVQGLAALEALLPRLEAAAAEVPRDTPDAPWFWLPEKDRPVLAGAIRLRCDALLTGDRTDFGAGYGRAFGGVVIHSPRSLLEHLFPVP